MSNRTIFVGNLPGDVKEREIEDLFYKYGPIVEVDLKLPPRPPGYCFIEFEDPQDAEDAIRGRDGYKFDGHRLRVEFAHGGRGPSSTNDHYSSYTSGGGNSARSSGAPRRTDYRVIITGLPSSASWQDLKDHMRKAGDVCYAQVFRDRGGTMGIADYTNYEDMKYAIRKLDDSEFRNLFSRSYIRVREDRGSGQKRSYSRSHSYSRSPSRSRSRSRAPQSKSRSQSPSRPRSRSVSPPRSRRPASRSRSASPRPLPSRSPKRSVSPGRSPSLSHSPSRSPPAKAPERSLSPASSNGD